MNILVTNENYSDFLKALKDTRRIGFDTETYGLDWFDKLFSMQFSFDGNNYYLNYQDYGPDAGIEILSRKTIAEVAATIDPESIVFIHNAKFDMNKLYLDGANLDHTNVHCTAAMERLIRNNYFGYSLDACLKRRGRAKNDKVKEWIVDNKAWEWEIIPGKKKRNKRMFYYKVPFDIMFEYGCDDGGDVLFLGNNQIDVMEKRDDAEHILKLHKREMKLTQVLHRMERIGIEVRMDYVEEGLKYEQEQIKKSRERIEEIAGRVYEGGRNWMQAVFDQLGISYSINPATGNPIFDSNALGLIDHPLTKEIEKLRKHEKYAGTYYSSFAYMARHDGVIRANINQGGTDTGRFSYSNPNLQNVPKEDDENLETPYRVRGCFKPREGHTLVAIDFDQQEYRLMLDYAGEAELIRAIMEDGEDVHTATGKMMSTPRKQAKTLNFMILYGGGVPILADALGVSEANAHEKRSKYFNRLPKVKALIDTIISVSKQRKWIFTWCNRRLYLPYNDRNNAYKMPNHLIQGGCADIVKEAMIRTDAYLQEHKGIGNMLMGIGNMLIQVHDELIFEIRDDQLHHINELKKIMEDVYTPRNGLYLTCGADISKTSWAYCDMEAYSAD